MRLRYEINVVQPDGVPRPCIRLEALENAQRIVSAIEDDLRLMNQHGRVAIVVWDMNNPEAGDLTLMDADEYEHTSGRLR